MAQIDAAIKEAEALLKRARTGVVLDDVFFAHRLLKLRPTVDPACKTMWTDGITLGYNPAWVAGLDLNTAKGILCHEVMHCLMLHHLRCGSRDPQKWNQATDYAINGILLQAGKTLPQGALVSDAYKGKSAEEIYGMLPDSPPDGNGGQGGQGGQRGQDGDPGGCGEVRPYPGPDGSGQPSKADLEQAEADEKISAQQGKALAKAVGSMPGSLSEVVDQLLEPKVDWKEALQRFVSQAAMDDYSWRKPNTRYQSTGVILPGLYSEKLVPIAVGIDTSGSVSSEDLRQIAGELDEILRVHKARVSVVYCDAKIQGTAEFTAEDSPITLKPAGRGGTSLHPVFDHFAEAEEEPACLVYFSDLEVSSFPADPGYPVMWIQTPGSGRKPPFGEVIKIKL